MRNFSISWLVSPACADSCSISSHGNDALGDAASAVSTNALPGESVKEESRDGTKAELVDERDGESWTPAPDEEDNNEDEDNDSEDEFDEESDPEEAEAEEEDDGEEADDDDEEDDKADKTRESEAEEAETDRAQLGSSEF